MAHGGIIGFAENFQVFPHSPVYLSSLNLHLHLWLRRRRPVQRSHSRPATPGPRPWRPAAGLRSYNPTLCRRNQRLRHRSDHPPLDTRHDGRKRKLHHHQRVPLPDLHQPALYRRYWRQSRPHPLNQQHGARSNGGHWPLRPQWRTLHTQPHRLHQYRRGHHRSLRLRSRRLHGRGHQSDWRQLLQLDWHRERLPNRSQSR